MRDAARAFLHVTTLLWSFAAILVAVYYAIGGFDTPSTPKCEPLGVVHVNDRPLLYLDCDGDIVREWLWVNDESED